MPCHLNFIADFFHTIQHLKLLASKAYIKRPSFSSSTEDVTRLAINRNPRVIEGYSSRPKGIIQLL